MRRIPPILAAALALALASCVPGGKQPSAKAVPVPPPPAPVAAAPAPPTGPLSTPQTHVDLPSPQPLSPEALASMEPPGAPPAPPKPAPTKKGQRPSQTASQTVRQEPAPATPVAIAPAQPPEPERAPIQEMVPAGEQERLKAEAEDKKRQIHALLGKVPRQRLNAQELGIVDTIRSFVKLSDQAERSGDMRKASELAERGLVLAKGLPVGK